MFNLQSKKMFVYLAAAAMIFCAINVLADWDVGGPHKMHFPQLPDPVGWDVNVSDYTLADDFLCMGDGSVKQVHFWISWTNDYEGIITNVHLSFHTDIPAEQSPTEYSIPSESSSNLCRTSLAGHELKPQEYFPLTCSCIVF